MPKRTKRPGAALIAAILLAGASQQALAQGTLAQATEQPENAAAPSRQGSSYENAINDIVVTAQKKGVAERAQDVPIALNAFSSSALEAAHVKDLTDISNLIPSVRLNPSGSVKGYGTFFIRGTGVLAPFHPMTLRSARS